METKAKLSKKILSMFLSLLMILSCVSVALPSLTSVADASTTAQWTALQNAFDAAKAAGVLSGANVSASTSGTTVTINDTNSGHLYKIADLMYAIVRADYASYTHHERMRSYIKGKLSLNSHQQNFVDTLLPIIGNYAYSSSSNCSYTGYTKDNYPSYGPFSGNLTMTVVINRSVKDAIVMDCATAAAVPANINTKITYSITAAPVTERADDYSSYWSTTHKSGTNNKTDTGYDYYFRNKGYYTNSGAPSYSYGTSAAPNLSAITSYLNYVGSASFKTGYDEWRGNPTNIYSWDIDVLKAVEPAYQPYRDALASIDVFYVNHFIGTTQKGLYDQYVDQCTGAVEAVTYLPVIEWIRDGAHLDGYLDRDSYEDHTQVRNPENRAYIEALLEDTVILQNIIQGCSAGLITAFQNVYGYSPSMFTNQIKTLTDLLEIYDLTDMYDEIIFRMTHDETEVYNGDPSLWGAKNFESDQFAEGECPVDDVMLQSVTAYFLAKVNAMENSFDVDNLNKVFADNGSEYTFADVQAFKNELVREVNYRGHESFFMDFYTYFESIRHERYQLVAFKSIRGLIVSAGAKAAELRSYYNRAVTELGAEKAAAIYGTYPDTIDAFVASLYDVLYDRAYQQHYNLLNSAYDIDNGAFDGKQADELDNSNFSAVKRNIKNIDNELYQWVLDNCNRSKYDVATIEKWHGFIPDYETAVANVIAQAWGAFKQVQMDTPAGSGYYTTRYAMPQDIVREDYLDEDDYVVTEAKILTVIGKLDGFITSEAFTKLLGVYRETAEPELDEDGNPTGKTLPAIHTLSEYIENLLLDMLFNDEMINTVIAMLFPMLTDLIGGLLLGLFDPEETMLDPTWMATPESGADGALNLLAIINSIGGVDGLTVKGGTLHAYFNGKKGTPRLAKAFSDLGIKIYPTYLAEALSSTANGKAGKYNAIISALKIAGEDWMYFDQETVGGNGDGEVTAADLEHYVWGVNDYTTFCAVIGDVFTAVLPVLQVLFTNYTYTTPKIENLLYFHGKNLDVNYKVDIQIGDAYGYGHLQLTLQGVEGYKNIWGTLFETLGVTATVANNNPTVTNPLSTTFGDSGASATAAQFANCMFMPLLSLIETLAAKPIDTVMGIIPNLMQSVAYGFVQPLLDAVSTNINLKASIEIEDTDNVEAVVDWGLDLSGIVNLFLGTINDALVDIINTDIPLELGGMLDLQELLGVEDLSDINGIINHFLVPAEDEEGEPEAQAEDDDEAKLDFSAISIPDINAGQWASLGHVLKTSSIRSKNFSNGLGAGQRYTIVADKADMLYTIVQWLLDFIAVEGNLSGLLATFGAGELPAEIDTILGAVDAHDAVASLIELFLPQDYALEDYDWYQSNEDGSRYNLTAADFVYLKYANNWTREKAEYLYNNVDEMANTIVNMIDPELLKGYSGVNEYLNGLINSMFNNEGIMNVIDLVNGIGEGLAGQDMIVNLIKDQISSGGADAGVDLLTWYRSFGYLTYDYTPKYDEETGELIVDEYAPLKPTDAGYVNDFPALEVEVVETPSVDENGAPVLDDDGNQIIDKEYFWKVDGEALIDGSDNARQVFTAIFCELLKPVAPIVGLLFTGTDLGLFNNAIVINGAECYSGAIIPVYEMFGIYDLYTQAEYNAHFKDDSAAGFEYLVNKLFDRVTELLTVDTIMVDGAMVTYGPVQKIIDILPDLFYFIQSDGISTLLKNLIHPIWNLVDTIRPLVDLDIDAIIHQFLTSYLGLVYDKTDTVNYPTAPIADLLMGLIDLGFETPEYSEAQAAKDKELVDGIFKLSFEELNLEAIYFVVETMFGIDLSPLSYALEGMAVPYTRDGNTYGVRAYQSKSGKTAYTLDYNGPDTLTVTFSAILDVLTYGENAAAIDAMLGFAKDVIPDEEGNLDNITASGLLDAIKNVFDDKADSMGEQPNWDYLLENKTVFGIDNDGNVDTNISAVWVDGDYQMLQKYSDLSMYHSINNLNYYTDWTEETAKATDEVLKNVLDFIVPMISDDATDFNSFINDLLATELFHADTVKALADLIGQLFDMIPIELLSIIDNMMDINLNSWAAYVEEKEVLDEEGNGTGEYAWGARENYKWWADPEAEEYIDTKEEFLDAIAEILNPVSNLFGVIFLGSDYRLFYSIGNGPGSVSYGKDAIVINGLNAYAKGIVPIFEALGLDLSNYKPEKYEAGVDENGNMIYDEELFVSDFVHIISDFIDLLSVDPVNWLVDTLPGLIYFINANGLSVSVMNIVDSLLEVLDAINGLLDEDSKIDLTNIEGIDVTNLTLGGIFSLIEDFTGLYIDGALLDYVNYLYVGQLQAYTSTNGLTAFTMDYSDVEERHDMITILLSLLLEIATDEGTYVDAEGVLVEYSNPEAIDALINGDDEDAVDYVSSIIGALKDPDSVIYQDIKWNYFDETVKLDDETKDDGVYVPAYAFQYLNYTTDWTYQSAATTATGLSDLVLAILKMTGSAEEDQTLSEALKAMLNLETVFSGETLQSLLDLVRPLLFGEEAVLNESLIRVIGAVLGAELTQWNNAYAFETTVEGETYTLDAETGLSYRDVDGVKTYGISTREEFITGVTIIFEPAYKLLGWLLFNDSYEFFNGNTDASADEVLLTIPGSDGYKQGLALLLEALGCEGLKFEREYKTVDANGHVEVDMKAFVSDLATSLFTLIDNILNDPVNELVKLIPELLYFINAGGLQVSVANLIASPISLVNKFAEISGDEGLNVDALIEDLLRSATENDELTFTLDGINLQYVFELVEMFTGLEITDPVGNKLDKFVMGEILPYNSVSEKIAYRTRFSADQDFADFITILLSFVIDVALWDGNAAAIEELAGLEPGLVEGIVNVIKEGWTIPVYEIEWFYFDENLTVDSEYDENTVITLPDRTINYIEYKSDWTEETADYIYNNRNEIISAVLSMTGNGDSTVAEIIAESFSLNEDLYTAENLNSILEAVAGLTANLDKSIKDLLGAVLAVDLSAYDTMAPFAEDAITDRASFVGGLYVILEPIFPVLNWLLFEDNIEFFDKDTDVENVDPDNGDIQVLLSVPGGAGYKYGLVPLFEALGVKIPEIKADDTIETEFYAVINNVLARLESILANPVDEALELIPNLIYFINANGLSATVKNLLGSVFGLLDTAEAEFGVVVDIDELLSDLLEMEVSIDKLDLVGIFEIVESFTGLKITETISKNKIDNFYLGQLNYFTSANGKPAFKMGYSTRETGADMLTIIVNLAVDLILNSETGAHNVAALEELLNLEPGTIKAIIDIIPILKAERNDEYNWNYMGFDEDPETGLIYTESHKTSPNAFYNYFTYKSNVIQDTANYFYDNADDLATGIIRMCGYDEASDTLAEMLDGAFNLYTADILNDLVGLVAKLYELLDEKLITAAGLLLDIDVSAWDGMVFTDEEITDRASFVNGLAKALKPLYRVLDWLLFGKSYEFFVESNNVDNKLLVLYGNEGYSNGLVPLLETLGVELPAMAANACCDTMLIPVLDAVAVRIDEVLDDVLGEGLDLIPNLFYFINANGLSVAVRGLAGSILSAVEYLNEQGIADIDLKELFGGIDIYNFNLEAVFQILEDTEVLGKFEFNNAFRGYTTVEQNPDGTYDVRFVRDLAGENIITKFYLGTLRNTTFSNGDRRYVMELTEEERGDIVVLLLSFCVDAILYGNNAAAMDEKFGLDNGIIANIAALFGQKFEFTPTGYNWTYFYDMTDEEIDEVIKSIADGTFKLPEQPVRTSQYLEYDNNWSEEFIQYLVENFNSIVDSVIAMSTDYPTLGAFLNDSINLYTNETANAMIQGVGDLLKSLDEYVVNHAGVLLGIDVDKIMNYEATGVVDKDTFVATLADAFNEAGTLLDLLLFDVDFELFTHLEDGEPALLTVSGNDGYNTALAPLLDVLGVEIELDSLPAAIEGMDKSTRTTITEQGVLEEILDNVFTRLDEILASPLDNALDILLDLIYFINADGLTAVVNNLLLPVTHVMEGINEEWILAEMLGIDLNDLGFETICALVKDATGIDIWSPVGEYLDNFYFGTLKYYTYPNGTNAFKMVYTEEEDRHDFITILLTVVLDVFSYEGNKDALVELFGEDGEDIYNAIMAFLTDSQVEVAPVPFDWLYLEYADTHKALSPVTMDPEVSIYDSVYGPLYTREMGEYISKWLPSFVDTTIVLLGVESPDGDVYDGLEDLLSTLIGTSIYKTDLLNTILDAIKGLIGDLEEGIGEELFTHITKVLDYALDVDLAYWDSYTVNEIAEGDRDAFVDELLRMLEPLYPILGWLLSDEDLAFFNRAEGPSDANDYVIISGAEGYAYGIIPILEALGCRAPSVLTPEEYKEATANDPAALLRYVIEPILDRVDVILEDPVNEIVAVLTSAIYFINSKGLDTALRNVLNAVFSVLETIEPLTGEIDLFEVIGLDLTLDIEALIDSLLASVAEDTGFQLKEVAMNAVLELTMGEVYSFTSANGDTAYSMRYVTGADTVDHVTTILRLVLTFVSIPENVVALEAMLEGELSEEGYKFLCSLLENFSQMAAQEGGMDEIMYTVYQIFYAANVAVHKTDDWLKEFNGDYSFLNNLFETSDLAFLRQLKSSLGDLLGKYVGDDIINDEQIAPNGFIAFFQKIAEFFQKIADFFKNLFS